MRAASYAEAAKISERPSRIVLAVSFDALNGRCDIITLGWKMRTSLEPPMVAVSVGKSRHSHGLMLREKEFVLAFPGEDIARQVLFCGTNSGDEADKFAETGLSPVRAEHVKPSLIAECPVNYECRLQGVLETGDRSIFAGEILACYVSEGNKLLVSAGDDDGCRLVLEEKGCRFGVVK